MTQRLCEQCKQPIPHRPRDGKEPPQKRRFCSMECYRANGTRRSQSRQATRCAHCRRVAYDRKRTICRYCQQSLPPNVLAQYHIEPTRKTWTKEQEDYLRQHYPSKGAHAVAEALGRPVKSILLKATRMGVNLTKGTMRRLVHSQAQAYMSSNNPMKRPEVQSKVRQWRGG